ncbi:MAG: adenylate/guanylate cyclase domain-containing protein [Planctomycetota bacterium]
MPDLIAQGPQNYHRWRREVPEPTTRIELVIGRNDADWNVPWDTTISRAHVRLVPQPDSRVEIIAIETARNPVFYRGLISKRFLLVPGEHFVIGDTTFTLSNRQAAIEAPSGGSSDDLGLAENVFDHVALRRKHFQDANARIDVLTRLPDLIASSDTDEELLVRVTSVLLQSTPVASSVTIVSGARLENDPDASIEILHYDNRNATLGGSAVSRRLVRRAVQKRESVLHIWHSGDAATFTAREDIDWAFCVPLRAEACRGWAIYIAGRTVDAQPSGEGAPSSLTDRLQDDVKFAELVGTTVGSLRQSRRLQRRQAAMRHFFAPVVMQAIATGDTDQVLEPRESDLTVMFCDLRGFSRRSEQESGQLLRLLSDVSNALGVMTKHILGFDGVIGDFHGDAAMGFWGWPLALDKTAHRAAGAARAIRAEYHSTDLGFRCGIGIAHGRAVAGRIGTTDQVKVTAFGPVVNLASRLESMTKRVGAEIVIDDTTRRLLLDEGSDIRVRRLANVRPAGFSSAVEISEVVCDDRITDAMIRDYEAALDRFSQDPQAAIDPLSQLPEWDGPTQFLRNTIRAGNHADGIIDLPK